MSPWCSSPCRDGCWSAVVAVTSTRERIWRTKGAGEGWIRQRLNRHDVDLAIAAHAVPQAAAKIVGQRISIRIEFALAADDEMHAFDPAANVPVPGAVVSELGFDRFGRLG